MDQTFLSAALEYAKRGFHVFPLKPASKVPLTKNGFKDATTDAAKIREWWTQNPNANIGITAGAMSGFWVLDIDGDEGESSLSKLEAQNSNLRHSLEVITGGGGRHIYFKWPQEHEIRCSAGKIGAGLDIRANGGYVVAPPSLHSSGRNYEWSVDSADIIAEAPSWLLSLVKVSPQGQKNPSEVDWASLLQGVSEGSRNDSLARLAGKLLGHRLDPYFALYLCAAWNDARCNPPLHQDELFKTFCSIANAEVKKRGIV